MIVKAVRTMEKIVEQTLLYDFYGELLTDHQKKVYEDVVFNDLSLSEAAEVHEQLNDAYPGITFSLIDYYGRRKPAFYAVRRACRNVSLFAARQRW